MTKCSTVTLKDPKYIRLTIHVVFFFKQHVRSSGSCKIILKKIPMLCYGWCKYLFASMNSLKNIHFSLRGRIREFKALLHSSRRNEQVESLLTAEKIKGWWGTLSVVGIKITEQSIKRPHLMPHCSTCHLQYKVPLVRLHHFISMYASHYILYLEMNVSFLQVGT